MKFLIHLFIVALSLGLAARIIPGIRADSWITLLLAAFLFGLVNAVLKPVLVLLTFPITILTLGLFLLVINAAMLGLVAWLLPGFAVDGFVPAMLAWLLVTLVGWVTAPFL
jgi:putative membrane protein